MIPISKPQRMVFRDKDAVCRCYFFFFFLLTAYLTSRHSITVARLGKVFGMTVAKGSLNKLQAASPHPPEMKPVGAFLPFFSLKLFLSVHWIKTTKQLPRESEILVFWEL